LPDTDKTKRLSMIIRMKRLSMIIRMKRLSMIIRMKIVIQRYGALAFTQKPHMIISNLGTTQMMKEESHCYRLYFKFRR